MASAVAYRDEAGHGPNPMTDLCPLTLKERNATSDIQRRFQAQKIVCNVWMSKDTLQNSNKFDFRGVAGK